MSTHTATIDTRGTLDTAGHHAAKGFWKRVFDRIVAARQAEADRLIASYVDKLSEQERKDLGFPAGGDMRR